MLKQVEDQSCTGENFNQEMLIVSLTSFIHGADVHSQTSLGSDGYHYHLSKLEPTGHWHGVMYVGTTTTTTKNNNKHCAYFMTDTLQAFVYNSLLNLHNHLMIEVLLLYSFQR